MKLFTETGSRGLVARGLGEEWKVLFSEYGVSVWENDNILMMGLHNHLSGLIATEHSCHINAEHETI